MNSREEEVQQFTKLIVAFDNHYKNGELNHQTIQRYQTKLDKLANSQSYIELLGKDRHLLYELQAVIEIAKGNFERANEFIDDTNYLMPSGQYYVSEVLDSYIASNSARQSKDISMPNDAKAPTSTYSGKIEGWLALYALRMVLIPIILLFDASSSFDTDTTGFASGFVNFIKIATIADVILAVCGFVMWYQFFSKKKITLVYARIFEGGVLLYYIALTSWLSSLISAYGLSEDGTVGKYTGYGFFAFLWLIYWFSSKRAKATFTR